VAILSNGTSGNINNIDFSGNAAPRKWKPYEKMAVVANEVAAEVVRVLRAVQYRDTVPLAVYQTEIPIGVRVPGTADIQWAESVLNRPAGKESTHVREAIYARRALDMKNLPERMPVLLQAMRVGNVGIAAIPAEVFVEIGLEIRKRSPFKQTFTISLANGWYGYLPTAEQHKVGGYETWRGTNRLEVDAASKIAAAITGLLQKLAASD
jgi:hypothetical protein